MDKHANNPLCPTCGYDLAGIIREDGTATCPECGNQADLIHITQPLTYPALHKRLACWIMLPTCAPALLSFSCVWVSNVSILWGMIFIPITLICSIALLGVILPGLLKRANDHAGMVQRRNIVLLSLLYLLPQFLLGLIYMRVAFIFMIPV